MINEFKSVFSKDTITINDRQLIETISLEDFLDPLFENEFVELVTDRYYYQTPQNNDDKFLLLVQESKVNDFMRKLTKEEEVKFTIK